MVVEIKDRQGQTRVSVPVQEGAKGVFSLMNSDYIQLPFSSENVIPFKLGDYTDLSDVLEDGLGGKIAKLYEVVDMNNVNPTYNETTGAYDYTLRLDAYYWKWKNKIFKYTPENAGQEASWSLTAALEVHLGVFLRNLKALGYTYKGTDFTFSIDDTVENKAIAVTYDNINLLDALFTLASKDYYNCDCWITNNVIHFGRNEFGDAVKIERGVEAESIGKAESKGTYATRIYAFGGTRNIPANYRPTEEQAVVNGVVQKRLMLPADTPYIDAYEGMSQEEAIEKIVVFDDIYPRRIGTMSNVTTVDRNIIEEGEVIGTFKAYQYKDTGLEFSEDYIIEEQELQIEFQSGKLNRMKFSVQFNPNDADPAEQLWEIVRNENYGRLLPDDIMKPANGDKYVLSGFNIQLVSDQYIPEAEKELKERAQEYTNIAKKDDGTYPVKLFSDYVFSDPLRHNYEFGQRVNLIDKTYFENGRVSRIIGWEVKLDIPFDSPQYTVGESMSYSRLQEIEDKVDALTYKGQTYTGGGGSGVYVIKTNDSTAPSDSNVFSALRTIASFLRKDKADETKFLIKFLGGLISDNIESQNFASGPFGTGFMIKRDPVTGKSYIEADEIYIRLKAYFDTLEIKHLSHVGGRVVLSPASMECVRVEIISTDMDALYDYNGDPLYDVESSRLYALKNATRAVNVYRCYFKQSDDTKEIVNEFAVDDLAQCREFNVKENVSHNVSNQYYWRRVVAVGKDYIDLSADDCDAGSMEPKAGDTIVTIGNKTNAARQHVVFLSSYDEDAPCIKLYSGINSYSMLNKEVTVISPNADKNVFTGKVVIKPGSTGFDNFEDGPDIDAINQDIADANKNAQDAINSANEANSAVGNLNEYIDGAFSDGIISESEAKAIEKYINIVNGEKASSESKYNVLYANPYLMGEAKTNLLNAKISFFGAIDNLISAINTAIEDGKTTVQEKNNVDSKYALYNSAYSDFNKAIEDANESIQNVLKSYSDEAERQAFEAANAASNAQDAANSAQGAVGDLNDYVDGAFSDGIIEKSEAQAIEKYINTVNQTKKEVEATYNVLYVNPYLTGTAKTALLNAKVTFFGDVDALIQSINTAISDGKTTASEKSDVDSKYNAFNSSYASLSTAIENANKAIQDKIKELAAQEAVDSIGTEIEDVTNEAKDDLAKKLGYTNYDAMVAAAESGKTVISGGHINTDLIEAAAIVTTALIASAIKTNTLNVNNKFIVEKDGTFKAVRGLLDEMIVNGAFRAPFKYNAFSEGIIIGGQKKQDTNNVILTNTSGGTVVTDLPGGEEYDGFTSTVINYDNNSNKTKGKIQLQCTYPIYEDSTSKTYIILESYEGVDIQGFSNGTTFMGWIVKNRFKLAESSVEMITITTRAEPSNGGTVNGGGTKPINTTGTLQAVANSGYIFKEWSDGVTNASRQVTWDMDKVYVAKFETKPVTKYTLTLNVSPNGSGSVTGAGQYDAGSEVRISATPNSGYAFVRWSDGDTNTSRYITMNSSKTFTAYFEQHTISDDNILAEPKVTVLQSTNDAFSAFIIGMLFINNKKTSEYEYADGILAINKGYLAGKIKAGLRYKLTFEHFGGDGQEAFYVGVGDLGEDPSNSTNWDLLYDGSVDAIVIGQGDSSQKTKFTKEFTARRTSTASDGLFFAGQVKDFVYIDNFELKEI